MNRTAFALRRGVLGACLALAWGAAHAWPVFLAAGSTHTETYDGDLGSLKLQGEGWRYRVRSYSNGDYYVAAHVTDVVVDCARRTRAELRGILISTSSAVEGPSPSPEPRRVYEGTRQSEEVDVVCRPGPPESAAGAAAPADPREPAGESPPAPPIGTTIGLIVDPEGLILVADRAVRRCPRLSVVAAGQRRDAELLNRGPMAGLAALRVAGGPYERLLPTDGPPPVGQAVMLIGFSSGGASQPSLDLAPVPWTWGWPIPDRHRAMGEALVVDTSGGLVEMVMADVDAPPDRPGGEVVGPRPVRQVLEFFGVDWSADGRLPPPRLARGHAAPGPRPGAGRMPRPSPLTALKPARSFRASAHSGFA